MMVGMGLGMVDRDIEVGREYKVGTFTLNGVTYDRYVKVIDFGALPNTTTKLVPHGTSITNKNQILGIAAIAVSSASAVTIPFVSAVSANVINIWCNETNISITPSFDATDYASCFVTLEYYK